MVISKNRVIFAAIKLKQNKMSVKIKFNKRDETDFVTTLKQRVNDYFEQRNKSKQGDWRMWAKLLFFFGGLIVVYSLLLSDFSTPVTFLLWVLMGLFIAFNGFNVAHDAVHGAFSSSPVLNKIFSYVFNLLGANEYMWKIMHNIVHHTYTNIPGHDEDLEPVDFIRLNTEKKLKKIHRYQHWYAMFFYSFASLSWVLKKDFVTFFSKQIGNYENKKHAWHEYVVLFFSKAVYFFIFLVLPMLLLSQPWWMVLSGFFLLHVVEGLTIAIVFQLAHVVENAEFPAPAEDGTMENVWAIHQVKTTANFARKSHLANWFFGGLNFQVEHHLFPQICHVHYRKISGIVKQTAEEFNLNYNEYETMFDAICSHLRMLKRLGREETISY